MIRDDESALGRSVQGGYGQPYMTGNNLATINEYVSNDGDVSNRSFSIKNEADKKYAFDFKTQPKSNMKQRYSFTRGITSVKDD